MNGYLTPQEAADTLKVKRAAIYEFIRQGKLKAVKVGGWILRIKKEDFEAFLQGD